MASGTPRTRVDGMPLIVSDPRQSHADAGSGPTAVTRVLAVTLVSPTGSTR